MIDQLDTAPHRPAVVVHGGAGRAETSAAAARADGCAKAAEAGWAILAEGGTAVDAVTAAVAYLEADPLFNAGVGACLTSDGTIELDASIMDGRRMAAGAVALVSSVVHPVQLARAVMDNGRHVLLAAAGAEAFARVQGLETVPPTHFITSRQRQRWETADQADHGTVGAVALDVCGHVAAATSTGGIMYKCRGRVGDSAVIGAGTYADDRAGAASATGHGEAIILAGLAKAAVDLLRQGVHPVLAAPQAVKIVSDAGPADAGLILVDRFGRVATALNTEHMPIGFRGG